jgi:hypothetical protein
MVSPWETLRVSSHSLSTNGLVRRGRYALLAQYLEHRTESTINSGGSRRREQEAPIRQGYGYERGGDGRSMYSQKSQFDNSEDEEAGVGLHSIFQDHIVSMDILNGSKPNTRWTRRL